MTNRHIRLQIDGKADGSELSKNLSYLTYFVENQGIALSREKILNSVWNYDYFGDARTIDTHVKKLREAKLGDKGRIHQNHLGYGLQIRGGIDEKTVD